MHSYFLTNASTIFVRKHKKLRTVLAGTEGANGGCGTRKRKLFPIRSLTLGIKPCDCTAYSKQVQEFNVQSHTF